MATERYLHIADLVILSCIHAFVANNISLCSQVNFENDARGKYLELLGYKKEELALKVR